MALSGSQDFTVTRDDIIKMSLQHIGAIGDGDTPSVTQVTEAALYLNMLLKFWQADDLQLWIRKLGYVLPQTFTTMPPKISLGAEGGHATNSYNFTTTTAAAVLGASTITVASTTGISNTFNIGIELSDGTMQWTTVSGAPAGLVVTLAATLTKAVASGASVYCYQTKILRPQRILDAYTRLSNATLANVTDTLLTKMTQEEYNAQPNKGATGTPNMWYYDEVLGLSTTLYPGNGDFYVWPIFADGDTLVVIQYIKTFDDLDGSTNNVEFPQTWFLPIMVGLAWLLSAKNGIPLNERKTLQQEAEFLKNQAKQFDQETGSIFFMPRAD